MKVNEIAGVGNHYEAKFWDYDPRTGRRWNLDPRPSPSLSSYVAFNDNPILYPDALGDTPRFKMRAWGNVYEPGKGWIEERKIVPATGKTLTDMQNGWNETKAYLHGMGEDDDLNFIDRCPWDVSIIASDENSHTTNDENGKLAIQWDPFGGLMTEDGYTLSPATVLAHEMDHYVFNVLLPEYHDKLRDAYDPNYDNYEEKRVITGRETRVAHKAGEIPDDKKVSRKYHSDHGIHKVKTKETAPHKKQDWQWGGTYKAQH